MIINVDWPESSHPEKLIFFPAPQLRQIFFPTALNGYEIDISFFGPMEKGDRRLYLDASSEVFRAGGWGGERIGLEQYAELLRTSRLSLNLPEFRRGFDQLTGRMTEIALSRSALVQPDGPNIRRFFEPGRDFIPLEGPDDLPGKIQYYLECDAEREEIAGNGWRRTVEEYSMERLWDAVKARL